MVTEKDLFEKLIKVTEILSDIWIIYGGPFLKLNQR